MYARVSFYDMAGATRDDAVRAFEGARSAVEQMAGNEGGTLLVSADGGKALTITLWESEDALRASEEQANQARSEAAGTAGMAVQAVEAYEVALEFGQQPSRV